MIHLASDDLQVVSDLVLSLDVRLGEGLELLQGCPMRLVDVPDVRLLNPDDVRDPSELVAVDGYCLVDQPHRFSDGVQGRLIERSLLECRVSRWVPHWV